MNKPAQHKHRVLADNLRTLATTLSPGDRMPSVPELVRQFHIASSTAQTAVETLRREGLIVRRRGSGTFVAEPTSRNGTAPFPSAKQGPLAVLALYAVPFFKHFVDHITREAAARSVPVLCRYDDQQMALGDALDLQAASPSGFFLVGWELEPVANALRARGQNVVLFGEPPPNGVASVPTVYGNSEYGGYLATRRLLSLGHRRITVVHGFETEGALLARRRWQGHVRALREAGLEPDHPLLEQPALSDKKGLDRLWALFHQPDAPTGVVAWSDDDAHALASTLGQLGMRVPHDVSIVGYGNLPRAQAGVGADDALPLDTVDPHLGVQVEHAWDLLNERRDGGSVPTALVTPTLVCRASCVPPHRSS